MTSDRRFEQELPALLDHLYMGPMPTYRDNVLRQTARTRQRPAWTFLERWLPVVDIARQPIIAPRLPWRAIGLGLVLLAVLIAMVAALVVGGRPNLPKPFGLARNGLVAYASGGDIYTVDPASGLATAVVTGPETDQKPVWSGDGTHFAFTRSAAGGADSLLFVARTDGSGLVALTPQPLPQLSSYAFSPDGREVAFISGPGADTQLWIAKADGSDLRRIDVGMSVRESAFRPPNGAEIVFAGNSATGGSGIYAVDVATGTLKTVVQPTAGVGLGWLRVAPDGSRVAYSASTTDPARNTYRVQVSAIDGTGTVTLPMPSGATFQDAAAWSNDSTRIAVARGYAARNEDMALAVLPADGSGVGIETARGLTGCCDTVLSWAPDDTSILMSPEDLNGQIQPQLLLDPVTGVSHTTPWVATGDPAWQRLAP